MNELPRTGHASTLTAAVHMQEHAGAGLAGQELLEEVGGGVGVGGGGGGLVVVVGVWGLKTDFKSACVSEEAACVRESASRSTGLARSARPSKWSINRSKPSKLKAAQGKPLPPSLQRARWETESGAREGGVPSRFR